MTFDRFRLAGWLISGGCLVATAGLIVNRHAAFTAAAQRVERADTELRQARVAADAAAAKRGERHFSCAVPKAGEETKFLMGLRRHARLAGVAIVRWSSHSSPVSQPTDRGGPPSADQTGADKLTEGVTRVSCDLTLAGSYPALSRFLNGLWNADRLYTFSNIVWSRAESGTELTMTLNRYLAPRASSDSGSAPNGTPEGALKP